MRMRQIVLICGLGAALMAGMAQAIERQDGFQAVQVESVQAMARHDAAPMVAQAEELTAAHTYRTEAAVSETAVGVGECASNAERMRQAIGAKESKLTSIASVTSPAKAPEDPGKSFS